MGTSPAFRPPVDRSNGPLVAGVTVLGIIAAAVLCFVYVQHQRQEEREAFERAQSQKRIDQSRRDAEERSRVARDQAKLDAEHEKREAATQAYAEVLDENTRRVLSGSKEFICQSCLGRGLTNDEKGPRVCQTCGGSGKTR